MSDSEKISSGWYIAFFLVGILLGLLVIRHSDVEDALLSVLDSQDDNTQQLNVSNNSVEDREKDQGATSTNRTVSKPKSKVAKEPAATELHAQPTPQPLTEPEIIPALPPAPEHEPIACNKKKAEAIRDKARELAEIVSYDNHLVVKLGKEWAYYSDSVKRSFVVKFIDSDTCLNGKSRAIEFSYQGKLYASADPERGVMFE